MAGVGLKEVGKGVIKQGGGPSASILDSRMSRVLEIERLFTAIDVYSQGVLDRTSILALMTALRKGHEIPEVPDVEVDGILNSIFDGQKMDYRVTREEFVQALYAWLEFQDSRSTIYRIHHEQALDRRRLHIDISLFFNQFEPPSDKRTLERHIGPEDDIDRLRRGGYSSSKTERKLALSKLNAAIESQGALLLQVYDAIHSSNPELVLSGLKFLEEIMEAVDAFPTSTERFSLRQQIWNIFLACTQSPSDSHAELKPLLPIIYRLPALLLETNDPAYHQAACAVLYYLLIGPRIPSAAPADPFHPSNFIHIKHHLAVTSAFLVIIWKVIKEAPDANTRMWAIKALGSFLEHDCEALHAGLEQNLLLQMLVLMNEIGETQPEVIRAGTYTIAVLCGHTHHAETAGEVLKEHLLSVRQVHNGAKDSQSLIVALWQLLRAHPDPLTRTHIILAVRHLVPLATEAPDYEYVNELVQVLGQGLNGLSEVMARSVTADSEDRSRQREQGQYAELTSAAAMSLLDALEDSKLMAYALESADLVEKTKKLLKLPAPWTRLTVLGLELCELMGKHQKYDHLLALADSLIPLLQREGQEGQLRTIRVLTYLSYAEPAKIYRLCSMGFPDAFFRTFQRFKQHDAVLMEAYGLRHHTYNADLIQGATSILRTFLLIQDTKCRALNLTAFGVGQVQAIMELHRSICKDVLSHVLLPNEPVTDLNDSLRALLLEIRTLHNQEDNSTRPAASKAVITSVSESIDGWRHDLPALSCSPHPLSISDLRDEDAGKVDGQKLVKCRNDSGRPVQVRLIPLWQGAREVATPIPSTCTMEELSEHVYDLYHVDKSALQFFFNAVDSRLQVALTDDSALSGLLRLFAESREILDIRVSFGSTVSAVPQGEPLVKVGFTTDVYQALNVLEMEVTADVERLISIIESYFQELSLDNPEARGLTWERLCVLLGLAMGYPGEHHVGYNHKRKELRIIWDVLDEGTGSLSFQRFAEGACVFALGSPEQKLLLVFQAAAGKHRATFLSRNELQKLFERICHDRPAADARIMAERAIEAEIDLGTGGANTLGLSFQGFVNQIRANPTLFSALTQTPVFENELENSLIYSLQGNPRWAGYSWAQGFMGGGGQGMMFNNGLGGLYGGGRRGRNWGRHRGGNGQMMMMMGGPWGGNNGYHHNRGMGKWQHHHYNHGGQQQGWGGRNRRRGGYRNRW